MASRMVTCSMTSRVHCSYWELITYCHATYRIDKIAWKYRKTANIIVKKTSVYHTVNGDRALFHTSKSAKVIKVILLSSTLTFWLGNNLYHFCCFQCVKQSTIAVNSVINWSFFYHRTWMALYSIVLIYRETTHSLTQEQFDSDQPLLPW